MAASLLVYLAFAGLNERPFSWHSILTNAVLKAIEITFVAALVWIAWRMVGGRMIVSDFITGYSYLFAAWLLIFALLTALDEGALRLFQPEVFTIIAGVASSGQDTRRLKDLLGPEGTYAVKVLLESDEEFNAAIRAPGFFWITSMAALRGAFTVLWLLLSWAAFRKMLGLSWTRFGVALAFFLACSLILILAIVFFQMAPIVVDPDRWLEKWPILRPAE